MSDVCDALSYLLDSIYIRFGTKLNRQIVEIQMGTNCVPLVADLFSEISWSRLTMAIKLEPVVQSIVSLTISLRHKFVKQISAKVTNTLLFFVEKM